MSSSASVGAGIVIAATVLRRLSYVNDLCRTWRGLRPSGLTLRHEDDEAHKDHDQAIVVLLFARSGGFARAVAAISRRGRGGAEGAQARPSTRQVRSGEPRFARLA